MGEQIPKTCEHYLSRGEHEYCRADYAAADKEQICVTYDCRDNGLGKARNFSLDDAVRNSKSIY